jgi:hypothetical protein
VVIRSCYYLKYSVDFKNNTCFQIRVTGNEEFNNRSHSNQSNAEVLPCLRCCYATDRRLICVDV